jgi:ABC-type transport system involved in cytochrome bd biosynthesis fused ATPase/permease subunit
MSVLELDGVEVTYERRGREKIKAVAGASLSVERGQIVGLVGESGCGKSSLARAAVGLVAPTAGTVRFEGRPVTPLSRRARARELARLRVRDAVLVEPARQPILVALEVDGVDELLDEPQRLGGRLRDVVARRHRDTSVSITMVSEKVASK